MPIVKSSELALNKVSPSKGALLIKTTSLNFTSALGKLLNKLKSASEKSSVAFTFLLTLFFIMSPILASKKKGAAMSTAIINNRITPIIFNIFLPIVYFYTDLFTRLF